MNTAAYERVWKLPLPATRKSVLAFLTFSANRAGECVPSVAEIASHCGMSVRCARMCLTDLEKAGMVTRTPRATTLTNRYTVQADALAAGAA